MSSTVSHNQPQRVSLVIPGRNCQRTIRQCLSAVTPLLGDPQSRLAEIIFVDDGSTDDTLNIVRSFAPVRCVADTGRGPAAARNTGWRVAKHPLIWFIDADCVAERDALSKLLPHMDDPLVGGVSGSYGIMNEHSLLARLIHEEIVARHAFMPSDVTFLATFNVLYRRAVLEQVDGFDERFITAEDAELSYRVQEAGYRLRFEYDSRVKHFHPQHLPAYLRTQRRHGYWRALLYMQHRGRALGDSYSGSLDHLQPPLAVLAAASLVLPIATLFASHEALRLTAWLPAVLFALLLLAQAPMTTTLLWRTKTPSMLLFAPMSAIRAIWRGVGMVHGLLHHTLTRRISKSPTSSNTPTASGS